MTPEEHSEAEIRGSVARAFDVPERLLGQPSDYLRPLFADPTTLWHRWFAWHPVETSDRGWVWLRRIYRRRCQMRLDLPYHGGDVYWQTAVNPHPAQETTQSGR